MIDQISLASDVVEASARAIEILDARYDSEEYELSCGDTAPMDVSTETIEVADAAEAVRVLRERGCTDPSSAPGWYPGDWYGCRYTADHGFSEHDVSASLKGFTEAEERAIYELVVRSC